MSKKDQHIITFHISKSRNTWLKFGLARRNKIEIKLTNSINF